MKGQFYFLLTICILAGTTTSGQNYPVSDIPDTILIGATIVVREYDRHFEMRSVNSAIETVRQVYTIFNRQGEDLASLDVGYDKDSKVRINQIVLFDRTGKKIKNVKQSDITDSPSFSDFELYSGEREITYDPSYPDYPYTVEYDYDINNENLISFGIWIPQNAYKLAVQNATLSIEYPDRFKINRKEMNISPAVKGHVKDKVTESWSIKNLSALEYEPFSSSVVDMIPSVYLMPSNLLYDKYSGNSDDWKKYGEWIYKLYSGRDQLPEEAIKKIKSIVRDIPDTLGMIKELYKYLQDNTRYVAITMGIGSFQPFDAETVFRTGYGDCKALTNYMSALLKTIGVKSCPALVSAGRTVKDIFPDFPNFMQFNHVILCIPFRKDTIWLECTNQQMPFGFLGDFTDQRQVLLITGNGGVFARTPLYDALDNKRVSSAFLKIDSTGTITSEIKILFTGLTYDEMEPLFGLNVNDLKKWYYANSSLPSLQVSGISLVQKKDMLPSLEMDVSLTSGNYASKSGKYLILPVNLLNNQKPIQKMLKKRHSDIVISRSFSEFDSTVYSIPTSMHPETLPEGIKLNTDFGSYSSSVSLRDNNIIYVRQFVLKGGRYKPLMYGKLYDFILAISKADNTKLLLSK